MIEDDPSNLRLIQMVLEAEGHRDVTALADPGQAFALIDEIDPAVMIVDLNMPGVSGRDILGWVERRPEARRPAVIVVSGEEDRARREVMAAGAHSFFTKPVDVRELIAAVDEALRERA